MPFDKVIEAIIQEAMRNGQFDDLPGKGKLIDLSEYFDTPEEVRAAYSILRNAGVLPPELELLKEIEELKQTLANITDDGQLFETQVLIQRKQMEFQLLMENSRRRVLKG